jgi:hypothetical protein
MISYYSLGGQKQINEIIFAGSHDAGMTTGDKNIRTQSVDIFLQAQAGVRIFDLRIAAETISGTKNAQLRAFHADGMLKKDETKTRYMPEFGRSETITRTKLRGGDFGMTLEKMLGDARSFVTSADGSTEFLLLKFDKCSNWGLIAEACVAILGDALYKGTGNLNKKTQQDLRGKVVVLFTPSGLQAVQHDYPPGSGILGIVNMKGGPAYDNNYNGLQYFGKGGTSPFNPYKKISQNEKKQAKLLKKGGHGNPDVMGMMYWTTTGLRESIYTRNEKMWNAPNKAKLLALWGNGLGEAIEDAIPKNVNMRVYSSGNVIKIFMPNMVMIDFADDDKCKTIFELNETAAAELVGLEGDLA